MKKTSVDPTKQNSVTSVNETFAGNSEKLLKDKTMLEVPPPAPDSPDHSKENTDNDGGITARDIKITTTAEISSEVDKTDKSEKTVSNKNENAHEKKKSTTNTAGEDEEDDDELDDDINDILDATKTLSTVQEETTPKAELAAVPKKPKAKLKPKERVKKEREKMQSVSDA